MKYKLQMEPEKVLDLVVQSVTRARNLVANVEWSAEDGTRTEIDFLCRCVEIAINAGDAQRARTGARDAEAPWRTETT